MQHLTRRAAKSLMIGDDVEITVIEVDGGTVKFAISAPNGTSIHESVVYVDIQRKRYQDVEKASLNIETPASRPKGEHFLWKAFTKQSNDNCSEPEL